MKVSSPQNTPEPKSHSPQLSAAFDPEPQVWSVRLWARGKGVRAHARVRQVVVSPLSEARGKGMPSLRTQFVFKMPWDTFHGCCSFCCWLAEASKSLQRPRPHHVLRVSTVAGGGTGGFFPFYVYK